MPGLIGARIPRLEDQPLLVGRGRYVDDIAVAGMLHASFVRSPHPHARVRSIDSSDAEKLPGVTMVLHRFNLPREYQRIKLGSGPPDRLLFPEEVFMVGTPIAHSQIVNRAAFSG